MDEIAIRTEGLSRDFNGLRAVDHLTLEVPAGAIFGFLGSNGSGKTTTINLLLGLLEPTQGRAEVLGFDTVAQSDEIRARVGALLEHNGLYEQMTAEANLEFYARAWRLPADERTARAKELLTDLGFWERRDEWVARRSRGMKQKLAMARTLVHRPPLVFLDEPTAGLDVVAATALRDDLADLVSKEGVTVFLTTHNMVEAERLCSLVAVIREGKLAAVGHPDELRARSGGPRLEIVGRGFTDSVVELLRTRWEVVSTGVENGRLTVELNDETDTSILVNLVVREGVQVEEVHRGKATLEEVFLTLMEEDR
jgi:ABC-2 type transport system ATP-binding protein